MLDVVSLAVGVVIGIALTLLAMWARRSSVTDLDAAAAPPRPSSTTAPVPVDVPGGGIESVLAAEIERAVEGQPTEGHFELGHEGSRLHITGVVHRMAVKVDRTTGTVSITSDGQAYRHLADIPDDRLRAEARRVLTSIATSDQPPEARAIAAAELEADGATAPSETPPGGAAAGGTVPDGTAPDGSAGA
jgi:hypothetical protein